MLKAVTDWSNFSKKKNVENLVDKSEWLKIASNLVDVLVNEASMPIKEVLIATDTIKAIFITSANQSEIRELSQ